jgi:hypothetical protein
MDVINSNLMALKAEAAKSSMNEKLAAVVINRRQLSKIHTNDNKSAANGCLSLHAEANALIKYYGRNLTYIRKKWRLL